MYNNFLLSNISNPFVFDYGVPTSDYGASFSRVDVIVSHGEDVILRVDDTSFTRTNFDNLKISLSGLKSALTQAFASEQGEVLYCTIALSFTTSGHMKSGSYDIAVYRDIIDKGLFYLSSLADPIALTNTGRVFYEEQEIGVVSSDGVHGYGFRDIVKHHMLANEFMTGTYYIHSNYPDVDLPKKEKYFVIFSNLIELDDPNVTHSKRLFNSSNVAVVPAGEAIYVSYQFPNPTVSKPKNCKLKFTYLVNDDIVTSTSSFNVPQGYHYFSINWANRLPTGLPFDKVIKIEVTTSVDDSQVFTIYPMRDKTYRKFTFVNRYNTQEIVYIPCAISSEQSTESEDAIVNDERIQYDKETFIDYTIKASAIYPQLIPVLRAMCKSSRILCGDSDIPVIITKYKLPKSEEQGADTSIEIGFRCAKIGADLLL